MKKGSKFFTIFIIFGLALLLVACEKEGPAEKAGKEIDQAMEKTEETLEEAMDEIDQDGPAEEAGEAVDEAAEEAKKKASQMKENVEETMNN